ncbi:MAG: AMP-binding protein [Thermoanaerobaculia bacterium]|jgi:long-subunit acyl-CoA synthetase (AMP-forming)
MQIEIPPARTVMDVLDETTTRFGARPALCFKQAERWEILAWSGYRDAVRLAARGMMRLGLQPRKGVAILGYNRPEWFVSCLGAIHAGGFPAGIYTTNSPEQCHYIAHHAEANIVVVENEFQLEKLLEVRKDLPDLRAIVLMSGESSEAGVHSWSELMRLGAEVAESELDARIAAQTPSDLCTLIYTSGTTGPPKAVMISHQNITWTAEAVAQVLEVGAEDRVVSYLPLSHIAEQVVSLYSPLRTGASSWFAESLELLGENLREVRPTVFLGVPRVWEKIEAKMRQFGDSAPPLRRKIAAWAKKVGLAGGYAIQRGERKPMSYGLAQKIVFSKVRERLGLDKARLCMTSAAPISLSTLEYFLSLGIPIYEVYGMSECTGPTTVQKPGIHRTGSVGIAAPGSELRIAPDGEVLMRGPHVFLGYYKNEVATREALDDEGWLHSGDVGVIDADGFLRITDRKKDILITAGGHNVAPQNIEKQLKAIPAVSQAVVVGDRMAYLVALFTLDPERLVHVAEAVGSPARDAAAASTCPRFISYLESQVDVVNKALARNEMVKRFAIVPTEFSIEGGELTPTMKIRRRVVLEKYHAIIGGLYDQTAGATAS